MQTPNYTFLSLKTLYPSILQNAAALNNQRQNYLVQNIMLQIIQLLGKSQSKNNSFLSEHTIIQFLSLKSLYPSTL